MVRRLLCLVLACGAALPVQARAVSATAVRQPSTVYRQHGSLIQTVVPIGNIARWHGSNSPRKPHIAALLTALRSRATPPQRATYLYVRETSHHATFELVGLPHAGHYLLAAWWRSAARVAGARWAPLPVAAAPGSYGLKIEGASLLPRVMVMAASGRIDLTYGPNRMLALTPSPHLPSMSSALTWLLQGRLLLSLPIASPATPRPLPPTATSTAGTPVVPTSTATSSNASTPTSGATFRITGSGSWSPASVTIRPGSDVSWENDDQQAAHPVQCFIGLGDDPCPWTGTLALPPGGRATVTFSRSGIFEFVDALHPSARGTIVVGAPH